MTVAGGGLARSLRVGATVALVLLLSAGLIYVVADRVMNPDSGPPDRALLVFASPDEDGTRVAWVVLDVDLAAKTVRAVDTSASIRLQGTSYSNLRDAFSFGGGPAVAEAYSRLASAPVLPALEIAEEDWLDLLGTGDGISVESSAGVNVFTGAELVGVAPGTAEITADSAKPLLLASAYLPIEDALVVRLKVAEATAKALMARPEMLVELAEGELFRGSMDVDFRKAFAERAVDVLPTAGFSLPK